MFFTEKKFWEPKKLFEDNFERFMTAICFWKQGWREKSGTGGFPEYKSSQALQSGENLAADGKTILKLLLAFQLSRWDELN